MGSFWTKTDIIMTCIISSSRKSLQCRYSRHMNKEMEIEKSRQSAGSSEYRGSFSIGGMKILYYVE